MAEKKLNIAIITTFPNHSWEIYSKAMLESFVQYWPAEIPLLVQLDDDLLVDQVQRILRPQDAIAVGWTKDHLDFVTRNQGKDDPQDYRKQGVRFCHKVFAIKRALGAALKERVKGGNPPTHLIWLDADVTITRPVTMDDINECFPKDAAVSYLGRRDWPHSECGFLAFDLEKGGDVWIDVWHGIYVADEVWKLPQWHDSWVFDHVRLSKDAPKSTNLTEGKPGMDIWPHSPMAKWSIHHKGPVAKQKIAPQIPQPKGKNFVIQTKNAIPNEDICRHISENQGLIKNWVKECTKTTEEIVVVSAGPQLWAEDVLEDYNNGKKIVAVKHALGRLKDAGIKPWACILLDPRPHVYDFVNDPDSEVIWFVASQVDPRVTMKLLAKGCEVWGYHASVNAGEGELIKKQATSIIGGGSATATRGLFLLRHLGFHKIKLFGYDLCYPDKPNMNALDDIGQPKYMELTVGWNNPLSPMRKCFWTEPQLIAQFEELNDLIEKNVFQFEAVGDGIVPFILKSKRGGELRQAKLKAKISKPVHYSKLLRWNNRKKTNFLQMLRRRLPRNLLKTI